MIFDYTIQVMIAIPAIIIATVIVAWLILERGDDDEFTEQEIKEILIAQKEMEAGNFLTEEELWEGMDDE